MFSTTCMFQLFFAWLSIVFAAGVSCWGLWHCFWSFANECPVCTGWWGSLEQLGWPWGLSLIEWVKGLEICTKFWSCDVFLNIEIEFIFYRFNPRNATLNLRILINLFFSHFDWPLKILLLDSDSSAFRFTLLTLALVLLCINSCFAVATFSEYLLSRFA